VVVGHAVCSRTIGHNRFAIEYKTNIVFKVYSLKPRVNVTFNCCMSKRLINLVISNGPRYVISLKFSGLVLSPSRSKRRSNVGKLSLSLNRSKRLIYSYKLRN